MTPIDVMVWVADGEASVGMDYGLRVENLLASRGLIVERADLCAHSRPRTQAPLNVLTGGATSVNEPEGWMPRALELTSELLEAAAEGHTEVIGICLGAQMIAHSMWPGAVRGGTTIEVGLQLVSWPDNGLPTSFAVPAFHYEEIAASRVREGGGQVIAWNAHSEVQGFRAGPGVVGVQFHPELTPDDMRLLVAHHRGTIERYGGKVEAALRSVDRLQATWKPTVFDRLLAEVSRGERANPAAR